MLLCLNERSGAAVLALVASRVAAPLILLPRSLSALREMTPGAVPVGEAAGESESAFFFKRLGEVCFTAEGRVSEAYAELGHLQALAVSNLYGITLFIDTQGDAPAHQRKESRDPQPL